MTLDRALIASIAAVLVVAALLAFRPEERPPELRDAPRPASMRADDFDPLPNRLSLAGEWWGRAGQAFVLVILGPGDTGRAAVEAPDGAVHVYRARRLVAWPLWLGRFSLMLQGEGDAGDGEWEMRFPAPNEPKPGAVLVTAVHGPLELEPFTLLRSHAHPPAPDDAISRHLLREHLAARAD
jgi:hypothetical protein